MRAIAAGPRGLILVGASRSQLDIDLVALAKATGKIPVQLAIDGSSYLPVLADLAADNRINGTVVVEFRGGVPDLDHQDSASHFVEAWHRGRHVGAAYGFEWIEGTLSEWRQAVFRSYADGGGPFQALTRRVLPRDVTPQYLVTLPSRSREADYSKVEMPALYYKRVMHNANIDDLPAMPDYAAVDRYLSARIQAIPQASSAGLTENGILVGQMVRKIEARGGKVIFVMYPESGLVRELDDVMYPRAVFWDRILPLVGGQGLYFSDEPSLRDFVCPDGSHLDVRDKRRFTEALARALELRGWVRSNS
jgi:hypothetical protein